MRHVLDILGYQAVWFAAVIGAGRDLAWPGLLAAAAFVGWHLATADSRAHAVRLVALALAVGLAFDGSLARADWLAYAAGWPPSLGALGAPPWILALWVAFTLTLTRSLALLQTRPWTAAALGAVGGPLAYVAAARGWNAVEFTAGAPVVTAALALGWGIALPVLARVARPGAVQEARA